MGILEEVRGVVKPKPGTGSLGAGLSIACHVHMAFIRKSRDPFWGSIIMRIIISAGLYLASSFKEAT